MSLMQVLQILLAVPYQLPPSLLNQGQLLASHLKSQSLHLLQACHLPLYSSQKYFACIEQNHIHRKHFIHWESLDMSKALAVQGNDSTIAQYCKWSQQASVLKRIIAGAQGVPTI